jgi:pyridoxine 5-phosphate synthase
MTQLSVNLNRIALLRNSRNIGLPNVLKFAQHAIDAGAHGITVHPRPDKRHITPDDVSDLMRFIAKAQREKPSLEFNIEGNPFSKPSDPAADFMHLIRLAKPVQATLVPDSDAQATSDHGWDIATDGERLTPLIAELKSLGCRVSLFMDADVAGMQWAKNVGADRIELYTKPFADVFHEPHKKAAIDVQLARYGTCIKAARTAGLGVNAGHDLNLINLPQLIALGGIDEVSIGHALIADALELGFVDAVRAYVAACKAK